MTTVNVELSRCSANYSRITVNTVDGFQGQERDIIIVSCVRAGKKEIGFLASPQRLNVALTRAKESLFVCGHFNTLGRASGWSDLIANAEERQVTCKVNSKVDVKELEKLITLQIEAA